MTQGTCLHSTVAACVRFHCWVCWGSHATNTDPDFEGKVLLLCSCCGYVRGVKRRESRFQPSGDVARLTSKQTVTALQMT